MSSLSPAQNTPLARRAGVFLGAVLGVVASFLSFPSVLPWMLAGWLAWHTGLAVRGRPAWLPLALGVPIGLMKGIWPPGVLAFAAGAGCVIGLEWVRRPTAPARAWPAAVFLWLAWVGMAIEWQHSIHTSRTPELDPSRPIVCFGDSLTSMGPKLGGYPRQLERLVSAPVVDFASPGRTAAAAVERLPDILALQPQAVVVELGGNDFVQLAGAAAVQRNLETIIATLRSEGIEVLLVEIPRGIGWDPYCGLERRLARRYDLELVPDSPIRWLVLRNSTAPPGTWLGPPYLSEDGLHPNEAGNALLATHVAEAIEDLF